jgi:hypothetical protein
MEFLVQNDARYLRRESVLKDKKVLFCGDSICSAAVYDYKDCPRWGWAGRSSSVTGLQYINKGLDGASLSTCRKDNRILFQIEACKDEKFDLIVLHGGVNDGWDAIAPGKMAEGFELEGFDTTTCCGGLEEHTAASANARADHNSYGGGKAKGTGAADNEDGDGAGYRVAEICPCDKPSDKGND